MRLAIHSAAAAVLLAVAGSSIAHAQSAPPVQQQPMPPLQQQPMAQPPGAQGMPQQQYVQPPPPAPPAPDRYSAAELVNSGHRFFGGVSRGLAQVIEKAVSQWGLPNGYVLGEEAGGAFVAGLRYGEGVLYTKNAGDLKVYWQGPSIGWDFGGDGARSMMLVYNLPATEAIYERFGGIEGSAYFIGGFGMTALTNANVVLVPIRAGVGLRLGANVGYLKFTPKPTWNPL